MQCARPPNGSAVFSVLRRRPVDLVVADLRMPTMDGWSLPPRSGSTGRTADAVHFPGSMHTFRSSQPYLGPSSPNRSTSIGSPPKCSSS